MFLNGEEKTGCETAVQKFCGVTLSLRGTNDQNLCAARRIFKKFYHGFHRWARIKQNKSTDPVEFGRVKSDSDLPEKNRRRNGFLWEEGADAEFMSRITPFRSKSICEICEIRGQFLLVPATPVQEIRGSIFWLWPQTTPGLCEEKCALGIREFNQIPAQLGSFSGINSLRSR